MTSPFSTSLFITGGAGFLGRGLLRYIEEAEIEANVTVYSRDEAKHYALRSRYPGVQTILGDVCDTDRLAAAMAGHKTVIHMAAVKHIPEAERDVAQAIKVNVDGSRSVAYAAMRAGVQQVVGISTDKACSPRNTYGATKMLMERVFQEANRQSQTVRFSNVRYGNVVSSTGSVIPLFREQLKTLGHVNITSTAMTRFWISVNGAVHLIESALRDEEDSGSTYVSPCPAMSILDVAQACYNHKDPVPYAVTGLRPGEKLHEQLIDDYEAPYTVSKKIDGESYFVIPDALRMRGEATVDVAPYRSDKPWEGMSIAQMRGLIEDAAKV